MSDTYPGPRPYRQRPPNQADLYHDDLDYNPAVEPRKSAAWLNLIEESEKAFEDWNMHCDNIDVRYANLMRLCDTARDKQYQLFWANSEVLKPAIYAKPPIPVVTPKFKDRRPVYQASSELLERCCSVAFDMGGINEVMLSIRDDLALLGRGVPWCRYEKPKGNYPERVCYDFKFRRDFLHSLSRNWTEVWWVAAASYLTRDEARNRFEPHSGDAYQDLEYRVDKDTQQLGGTDNRERAKIWEVWNKHERRVVWVGVGAEAILDEADPHLDLQYFWPCPKPAYGSLQRGSLVPVPDVLQYKDQLDEIDMLTGRIHALSDVIEAKGFYPAGGGDTADAIERAIQYKTAGRVLVPISNWAAFGGSKEVIIWLPIDMISQVVTTLVELRKQVIDDVYQIMGLSDIMRGATDPRETLGAQQMKSDYGGTRVRDKQYELERIARDLVCISADIITQKFDDVTLIEMSQTQLPTQEMQQQLIVQQQQQLALQLQPLQQQAQQPAPPPAMAVPGTPSPADAANQQIATLQQTSAAAIQQIHAQPTIEQVLTFLHDRRARVFTLDIETDSTIVADEVAEKQGRTEFLGMLSNLLPQLMQMVVAAPQSASFCGEVLKFAVGPFRAGRSLDGSIDELAEQSKLIAQQPKPEDPTVGTNKTALQIEQIKQMRQSQQDQATNQLKAQELQLTDQQKHRQMDIQLEIERMKQRTGNMSDMAKTAQTQQKMQSEREKHQMDMAGKVLDMQSAQQRAQQQSSAAAQAAQLKQQQAVRQPPQPGAF